MTPFRKLFLIVVAICTTVAIVSTVANRLHPEWMPAPTFRMSSMRFRRPPPRPITPFRKLFLIVVAISTVVAIGTFVASRLHPEWVRAVRCVAAASLTYHLTRNDVDHVVFCFTRAEDAEAFAERFGGEPLASPGA